MKYRDKYDAAYRQISDELSQGARSREVAAKLPPKESENKYSPRRPDPSEDFVNLQNSYDSTDHRALP
jgi:hypothetical protein